MVIYFNIQLGGNMKNHELTPDHFGNWDADDSHYENTDPYAYDEENLAESNAYDYEKQLDNVDARVVHLAESNVDRLLADLTWRGVGGSPKERYNKEHRKKEIDRLRLFSEAELLFDYSLRKDYENIPKSKFFRHLADTCHYGYRTVDTVPLSESETEHFHKTAANFTEHLSTHNSREHSFANYVKSLVRMCASAYGKDSRAMMYLCDDLDQMLGSEDNKSKIIDRLIERKLDVVQKISMGETKAPAPSGRILIGFTGTLDLPEGIENHSIKELVDEGVPSLYGYNE